MCSCGCINPGEIWLDTLGNIRTLDRQTLNARAKALEEFGESSCDASLCYAAGLLRYVHQQGAPRAINILGTMGCGKSSLAATLASRLGWNFKDADLFHSPVAKQKMAQGLPLDTKDRLPFLHGVRQHLSGPHSLSTCSALRSSYRAYLCGASAKVLEDSFQGDAWEHVPPDTGLLFVQLMKPAAIALTELDFAYRSAPRSLQDGSPHYIRVSREDSQILMNQYTLLAQDPIQPWLAFTLNTEDYRETQGDKDSGISLPSRYNLLRMVDKIERHLGLSSTPP